jgi:magnesium-transporting ATPase (P-type)
MNSHDRPIRDGHLSAVLANQLVPGDIVRFSVGDRIPADIRLLTVRTSSICSIHLVNPLTNIKIFRLWIWKLMNPI